MAVRFEAEVAVSAAAGVLAVVALVVGQVAHDAILRALASGLLVLCFSSALRARRRRRQRSAGQHR